MKSAAYQQIFRFKPLQTAKVSEISEATAASSVSAEDRINFHIGNPVQDDRLHTLYYRLVMNPVGLAENENNAFLGETISKASPYAPRGGYHSRQPHPLVKKVQHWAVREQSDSLLYHLGEKNTPREMIIGSGGIVETLRVFLLTLSRFQHEKPVYIHLDKMNLPEHLLHFPGLIISTLPQEENKALSGLKSALKSQSSHPHYLLSGDTGSEAFRRNLHNLARNSPLFFVEINDTANSKSMAREAQMADKVLRILSPRILNPALNFPATVFILGTAELIRLQETVHFELKGTPSSPEMELLSHLLESDNVKDKKPQESNVAITRDNEDILSFSGRLLENSDAFVAGLGQKINLLQKKYQKIVDENLNNAAKLISRVHPAGQADIFSGTSADSLLNQLQKQKNLAVFLPTIEQSMLTAFLSHHPFYRQEHSTVVSGSARTALSLLGFHCGIEEVISVDLSWTYQHCFPKVHTVSLKDDLSLDTASIIQTIKRKLQQSMYWPKQGAVVLNNPHNATGKVFPESTLKELLRQLLRLKIRVIDDLSYQNVGPEAKQGHIKTLKELVLELHRSGYVTVEESRQLITVHSLSKTDSFAGARLAVVEIPDQELLAKFEKINQTVSKNSLSILLAYLFYRNDRDSVSAYWQLRNNIFTGRMKAIKEAAENLPTDRNPFAIKIHVPEGSMYPRLEIGKLPASLSLDWLATQLATEGTGLIPLSTFAKTASGYRVARNSFRLTLGGSADPAKLSDQTRRVLIDLNRLLALESAKYSRQSILPKTTSPLITVLPPAWEQVLEQIKNTAIRQLPVRSKLFPSAEADAYRRIFLEDFLPFRLSVFQKRLMDYFEQRRMLENLSPEEIHRQLLPVLEKEFFKDDLNSRRTQFKNRMFDRTVHPTQMYALHVDTLFQNLLETVLPGKAALSQLIKALGTALCDEFIGSNIAISSVEEGHELLLDLNIFGSSENYMRLVSDSSSPFLLSFWGDWDGSTRPSGQGHRLVAAVLLENIKRMAAIVELINRHYAHLKIDPELLSQIRKQPAKNQKLWNLFNRITHLTTQLESRHRNLVRLDLAAGKWQQLGHALHLLKDPVESQWQHNDRLERKMKSLRLQRRQGLEAAFRLNKQLRKTIYGLLPDLSSSLHHPVLLHSLGAYRDLLKRFVLTPRIHQKIITSDDAFAIDTTVFNINEINEIGAAYGNPGLILGLQISMSTGPEALIDLERKLSSRRETILQKNGTLALPAVWPIPLFEDADSVIHIEDYLDNIWQYAERTKSLLQNSATRFSEILCEVFFAGSDLSQQVSQAKAAELYAQAKYEVYRWLGRKGLTGKVRVKLGSGEPMQRQGGYYDARSGQTAFINNSNSQKLLKTYLAPPDVLSTKFATSPLRGVLAGGDLRTFQSNLMEHIRLLEVPERAALLKQVQHNQTQFKKDIVALSEPLTKTRLQVKENSHKALKLLCAVGEDENYQRFLELYSSVFRTILYGSEEDVLGIHIISYFISRAVPTLRDRPTVRPTVDTGQKTGQKVVDRIAHTLPLAQHGTMLRAIGHSHAQTMILGISQLSSGLFPTINKFLLMPDLPTEAELLLRNNILPKLPVYEILHNLRIFQDRQLHYFSAFDSLFPNWNSAVITLREDRDLMERYIPLLQKELVRKLGLNTNAFFDDNVFKPGLLPTLQPDLAVLLQKNLFNTDVESFLSESDFIPDAPWHQEIRKLLEMPAKIQGWRKKIWELIREPIFEQVKSFNKLAYAITALSQSQSSGEVLPTVLQGKISHLSAVINKSLFTDSDDRMKDFLENSVKYLSGLQAQNQEVPISAIRALRDVERIVKIEQQPLPPEKQKLLSFYILQIARIAGENG